MRDPARRRDALFTLSGPGGTGKTRLALQEAADLLDDFPDSTYFVPLATLTNDSPVIELIKNACAGCAPLLKRGRGLDPRSARGEA